MNTYLRLAIAVLISLLVHAIVLVWVMPRVKVHANDDRGLLQVFLRKNTSEPARQQLASSAEQASLSNKSLVAKHVEAPAKIVQTDRNDLAGAPTSGHFRWQSLPAYQQSEIMNAMQLAQLAYQRESQVAAVMAGMSNLSAQMRPVMTGKFDCAQQPNNEINCTPVPKDNERPYLLQFFNLATEARRLGIAENPVRMDFGPESWVSITLLH
jgi:hypothetical protein